MLTILYGRAGSGKSRRIAAHIREHVARGEGGVVLIVPEQYSHETERRLATVCGDRLSLYAEVLSFTRLANRVLTECGGLADPMPDKGGKLLLMHLTVTALADNLSVYGRHGRNVEFLRSLLNAREELVACMLGPAELREAAARTGGTVREKLLDLALICEYYELLLHQRLEDARDRLTRLADCIEQSHVGCGGVYIDSFTDFTGQELEVIDRLLVRDTPLTVALTADVEDSEAFRIARLTMERLKTMAQARGVAVREEHLAGAKTGAPADLQYLERALTDYGAPPYTGACDSIELYALHDTVSECEVAAARILALLREDETLRCREIAVAVGDVDQYGAIAESIFDLYGLPLFTDRRTDILQKPVLALVTGALETVTGGWQYRHIFKYLKTGLTGLEPDARDELENYCLAWNIRGERLWTQTDAWSMNPRGYVTESTAADEAALARLDALRREVAAPLLELREAGRRTKTAGGQVRALYAFMERIGLAGILEARTLDLRGQGRLRLAEEYAQLWDILVGALEQCDEILGEGELTQEGFAELLPLVLSQYDTGSIPVALDRVTLCDFAALRERDVRVALVLGATDSAIPRLRERAGVFSDAERRELMQLGVRLGTLEDDEICRELATVYSALTAPRERLLISYPTGGESQARPSFVIERVRAVFGVEPVTQAQLGETYRVAAPAPCIRYAAAGKSTPLHAAARAALLQEPAWAAALDTLDRRAETVRGRLSPDAVTALFGESFHVSASRIEKYNTCRFSYLMKYGLRAKPRKRAGFEAPEMGTFIHYILENVTREVKARGGFSKVDEPVCRALANQYIEQYSARVLGSGKNHSSRFLYLFGRLKNVVAEIVLEVARELMDSDFEPLDFELHFAGNGELPPAIIEHDGMQLAISGVVDRVDGWVCGDKLYLRVADYKTGRTEFKLSDVWYGLGLQMLIYLFALEKHGAARYGRQIVPAGILYSPARDVVLSLPRGTSDEEVARERAKKLRRSGLLLAQPEVIEAMEHGEEKKRIPVKLRDGVATGSVATAAQLGRLGQHVERLLTELGEEMKAGHIEADPFIIGGKRAACAWCEYAAACGFDESKDCARRYIGYRADEVWRMIGEECGDG